MISVKSLTAKMMLYVLLVLLHKTTSYIFYGQRYALWIN